MTTITLSAKRKWYDPDGCSYCQRVLTDSAQGEDMFEFLQGFFDRYPQYAKLPLFVTGERSVRHVRAVGR